MVAIVVPSTIFADDLLGLPPLPVPSDNPQSPEKVVLGRILFNDKRFSGDGTVSCLSCHSPDKVFTDGLPRAIGIEQQEGPRNSPSIVNAAFYTSWFLDGRRESLEKQALDPFLNPMEHGLATHQSIVDIVRKDANYVEKFKRVFNLNLDEITIDHVVSAIASYERTLISGNSSFDRYFFGGNRQALSKSAERGLKVFRRKGNCANCHEIGWDHALFTDNRFYNIGVGFKQLKPVLKKYLEVLRDDHINDDNLLSDVQRSELGRFNVTRVMADIGKFKTPTLRNIELTAPYMHDGSMKNLDEVVEYYDRGGEPNAYLDPAIFPLKLTVQEKADLVAFLKALTSPKYVQPH